MLFIILSVFFALLFVLTDYGTMVLYGIGKVLTVMISLYFDCFILLGVLMLIVKVKVTSVIKGMLC